MARFQVAGQIFTIGPPCTGTAIIAVVGDPVVGAIATARKPIRRRTHEVDNRTITYFGAAGTIQFCSKKKVFVALRSITVDDARKPPTHSKQHGRNGAQARMRSITAKTAVV